MGDVASWWPKVAQRVAQTAAHRPALQQLSPDSASTTKLLLRPEKPVPISAKLKEALTSATYEVTGRRLVVELTPVAAPAAVAPAAVPAAKPAASAPATESTPPDEGLENLMTMFDATPVAPESEQ
jgi:hypothetical protein